MGKLRARVAPLVAHLGGEPTAVETELIEQAARLSLLADMAQRVRPMPGFKRFTSAARFCLVCDGLRNFLRPVTARNQKVSLPRRRLMYTRTASLRLDETAKGRVIFARLAEHAMHLLRAGGHLLARP